MMKEIGAIAAPLMGLTNMIKDNIAVMKTLQETGIRWADTRPGLIKESESGGSLKICEAMPGGGIAFVDLAAFTPNTLTSTEYDGKFPSCSTSHPVKLSRSYPPSSRHTESRCLFSMNMSS